MSEATRKRRQPTGAGHAHDEIPSFSPLDSSKQRRQTTVERLVWIICLVPRTVYRECQALYLRWRLHVYWHSSLLPRVGVIKNMLLGWLVFSRSPDATAYRYRLTIVIMTTTTTILVGTFGLLSVDRPIPLLLDVLPTAPFPIIPPSLALPETPDFGGLLVGENHGAPRIIPPNHEDLFHDFKALRESDDEHVSYLYWNEQDLADLQFTCRRPSFSQTIHPTCLDVHSVDLSMDFVDAREQHADSPHHSTNIQDFDTYYLGHGFYRDVWVHSKPAYPAAERGILKTLRTLQAFDHRNEFQVRMEAIVMEALTAFPQIVTMYSYCGTTVLVEAVPHEVEEYVVPDSGYWHHDEAPVKPRNRFSLQDKLEMALEMAESLAVLHGYSGGVIVHDDVQLRQWLRTGEGKLKLGDFNRATIMNWNVQTQAYCKFGNGAAFGNYRAPEEFAMGDLNEKIDVFSMGNNIYSLLTGLWVFYDQEDDSVVQQLVLDGKKPFVDPKLRKPAHENRPSTMLESLVAIMEDCWEFHPDTRVEIFDVVRRLRETLAAHVPDPRHG